MKANLYVQFAAKLGWNVDGLRLYTPLYCSPSLVGPMAISMVRKLMVGSENMYCVFCNDKHRWLNASDPDQSRLQPSFVHTHSGRAPLGSTVFSASSGLNLETYDALPAPSYASSLPGLDQILFTATENPNFNAPKPARIIETIAKTPPALIDREAAFLLRIYEEGIGVWMDVFDSSSSYQHVLLTLVPSSPLLLYSTCALAARQLSLISCARTWTPVAERYYGNSLSLLRALLAESTMDSEHAIVASMLLSSYELLKSPSHHSYHQHFRGAKSLVEALRAYDSPKRLTTASFWIYARHEVGQALNLQRPAMLDPGLWPKADSSKDEVEYPDVPCNDVLRISCKVMNFVFGTSDERQGGIWAKRWQSLHTDLDDWLLETPTILTGKQYRCHESRRFWFPRPAFASAMCFYHVSKMFLALYPPDPMATIADRERGPREEIQYQAKEIIDIALSDLPDSVMVTMVQMIFHAAKQVDDPERRGEAISRLEQIQIETGFHTESQVQILKSGSKP